MTLTRETDMAMDRLANTSPIWEEPKYKTKANKSFKAIQKTDITISLGDLNKALFKGGHYQYDFNNGSGHSFKGCAYDHNIEISFKKSGKREIVNATLQSAQGQQKIELNFENNNGQCTLIYGWISKKERKESLLDPKRLSDVLLCLYKHVRLTADKKFADTYLMETEAREVAAQRLNTRRLPTIIADNNGHLSYNAPSKGCERICGQKTCSAKAMMVKFG